MGKGKKKSRRQDDDDDWMAEADALRAEAGLDDPAEALEEPRPAPKQKKKKKKGKKQSNDEELDEPEPKTDVGAFAGLAVDDDEDEVEELPKQKSSSGFSGLVIEDSEDDVDDVPPPKKSGFGGFGGLEVDDDDQEEEEESLPIVKGKQSGFAGLEIEDEDEELEEQPKKSSGFAGLEIEDDDDLLDEWDDEPKKGKKNKKNKGVNLDDELQDESVIDAPTVKTAAQKKAEKKERDRLKKQKEREKKAAKKKQKKQEEEEEDLDKILAEIEDSSSKKDKEKKGKKKDDDLDDILKQIEGEAPMPVPKDKPAEQPETPASPAVNEAEPSAETEPKVEADADNTGSSSKKKKKKKKKKSEDDSKTAEAPKKKPSKFAAALKKQMEEKEREEERLRKEREEEERRLEELRRIEEEELRLEEERKELEKQRRKERKAQLRAEGKAVTKAQKEKERLKEEKLKQMLAMGIQVPALSDDQPKKKPVYGKKKKKSKSTSSKNSQDEPTEKPVEEEPTAPEETSTEAIKAQDEPVTEAQQEEAEESDDALDDWEAFDEEEDKGDDKKETTTKPTKSGNEEDSDDEDDDDDDDDSDDDDSDEVQEVKSSGKRNEPVDKHAVRMRILERQRLAEENMDMDNLRSPVCAVMGHVDTGKTKILDRIRSSNVQDNEVGGITQQIGATFIPAEEIQKQVKSIRKAQSMEWKIPGLLVIDTPGHESFSNLRTRGSSMCNIAILVVDIMHGIEPQTAESIQLLRKRKAPFVIALNKVDRLVDWRVTKNAAIQNTLKKQKANTMQDFESRLSLVKLQFAEQGLNTELYYDNKDFRNYISIIPTSAHTGEGIPDLLFMLVFLTQKYLPKHLALRSELECTVLEVKEIQGYGTTVDVILTNGHLREGDQIVVGGLEGPIVTTIRSLLMPAPMKEMRVKNSYIQHKEIQAAQGIKIAAKDLEKAVAGLPLFVVQSPDELEVLKEDADKLLQDTLKSIKTVDLGVCVQASTLGSLEALLEFLKTIKIPVSAVNIGPVHKRDVTRATVQLNRDRRYAVILAFDVPVDREAQLMANREGVKIFTADIIYHLEEAFKGYLEEIKQQQREQYKYIATFPCRLRILPDCIFRARDPIVIGVHVEEGIVKQGTKVVIPKKEFLEIGTIASVQHNNEDVESAKKGEEVCIKIESTGDQKKMFGRHFDENDELVSKISRESIDACKNYFREDLGKEDWKLMKKLKSVFQIL